MRLAVIRTAELCNQTGLDSHPMQEFKSEGALPGWFVWVEELDYQR